jgi:prepilin-type N-terminal cleavage/methylation domain-containing protein
MKRPLRRRPATGFTLIEVLIALAIVSLVAVLSWQGLDNVIRLTRRVQTLDDQWDQIRSVFAQLERDLKTVSNPRLTGLSASTAGNPSGAARSPGTRPDGGSATVDETDRLAMLRAGNRPDVIVENDDALDQVIDNLNANTQKVQVQLNSLIITMQGSNPKDGPTTSQAVWRLQGGQLLRQSTVLLTDRMSNGVGNTTVASNSTGLGRDASGRTLFDEPGLTLRGVGIRLWIEGRGWDTEKNLGEPLPPADAGLPLQDAASSATAAPANPGINPNPNPNPNTPPAGAGTNPAGFRITGMQLRLWLPSGEIYTRVFMVGQAS